MTTKSIRLDADLIFQAQSAAAMHCRSVSNQVEYWASLGRIISSVIGIEDAFAVLQGLKKLRLEPAQNVSVDSNTVFNNLESDRAKGFTDKQITSAPFYFETSRKTPGFIDRVDSQTGGRKTGRFNNGEFREINTK